MLKTLRQNSNATQSLLGPSEILVGLGSGWIRVWHQKQGLILELPSIVAVDVQTGEPIAWFEEAAALEGRAPEGVVCVRPWYGDEIQDRVILRALLVQLGEVLRSEPQVGATTQRVAWGVPVTVSQLHISWIERTLAESGWWWPRVQRFNFSDLMESGKQTLIWDWGASSSRWSVWVDGTPMVSRSFPNLGLAAVIDELVQTEKNITQRQYSHATLFDLLWSVRHPAFDIAQQKPILEPLSKTTLQQVQDSWAQALSQAWQKFQQDIPPETAAQLAVSQSFVVGGGASLRAWIELAESVTHISWKVAKDPLYAEIRGRTF